MRWLTQNLGAVAAVVIAVVAGVIAVTVFTGDDSTGNDPAGNAPAAENPEADEPRAPLTGEPLEEGDELDRPAVAVKVSDVPQARPQVGVDAADIVLVQQIAANTPRLTGVFHTEVPDAAGPVRSIRPADAPLLGPLSAVFANTMGSEWIMEYVDANADLDSLGTQRVPGTDAYTIDDARPAPDHVFADPASLLELSDVDEPPEPYFAYAAEQQPSSAERAGEPGQTAELNYGSGAPVSWTYDDSAEHYLRSDGQGEHVMADGARVSAVNVVVIEVSYEDGKIGDGAGASVLIPELVDGEGSFVALAGGESVTGTWSKAGENDGFELRTDDGEELELAPGNTWVELPEPSVGATTG